MNPFFKDAPSQFSFLFSQPLFCLSFFWYALVTLGAHMGFTTTGGRLLICLAGPWSGSALQATHGTEEVVANVQSACIR